MLQLQNLDELADLLPGGRKAIDDHFKKKAADAKAARSAIAKRLAEVNKSFEAERLKSQQAFAVAKEELAEAQAMVKSATEAARVAYGKLYSINARHDQQRDQLQAALRDCTPAEITAFRAELAALREPKLEVFVQTFELWMGNSKPAITLSNGSQIEAWRLAVRAAAEAAEALVYSDDDDLPAKVTAIRQSIPVVGLPQRLDFKDVIYHGPATTREGTSLGPSYLEHKSPEGSRFYPVHWVSGGSVIVTNY